MVCSIVVSSPYTDPEKRSLALLNAVTVLGSSEGGYEHGVATLALVNMSIVPQAWQRAQLAFVDVRVC